MIENVLQIMPLWLAGIFLVLLCLLGYEAGRFIHKRFSGDPAIERPRSDAENYIIGAIFGLVNAVVRPLVSFLSLPITILTLGLFTIVINAAMLYLTSWLSSYTPVSFTIDSFFWTALLAAIIITAVSLVAGLLPGGRRR